jgi:hypothetical protein
MVGRVALEVLPLESTFLGAKQLLDDQRSHLPRQVVNPSALPLCPLSFATSGDQINRQILCY